MTKEKKTARREAAPKKTGKRGPMPLDPVKDFEEPVRKESEGQEPEQKELLAIPKPPEPTIQHGKMGVYFIKFVPDRSKDGKRTVYLDISLELEDGHAGRIPREVEDQWRHLKRGNVKRVDVDGIGSQNLKAFIVPDGQVDLEVVAAVSKATISRVTEKGKGKERKVTRLEIRFLTNFTKDVEQFCANNYDETIWITMKDSQRSFDDSEGE